MANRRVQKTRNSNPREYTATGISIDKHGKPRVHPNGKLDDNFPMLGLAVKVFSLKSIREYRLRKREKPYVIEHKELI